MESSIVIKINFVDEFRFLCFEESIKVLCPFFVIFHFSKKERIELLEIKERIFKFYSECNLVVCISLQFPLLESWDDD